MSDKNYMAFGDAETVLTGFATDIKAKQPKTLDTPITISGQQQTTVEGALGALVGSVADGKTSVASAITNKGVQASTNDTLTQLASKISSIPSNDFNNQLILELQFVGSSTVGGSCYLCNLFGQFVGRTIKKIYAKCLSKSGSPSLNCTITLWDSTNGYHDILLFSTTASAGNETTLNYSVSDNLKFAEGNVGVTNTKIYIPKGFKIRCEIEFY